MKVTTILFKEFIKNCYVENYGDSIYHIIFNDDYDVSYSVDTNGWSITDYNNVQDGLNDAQREVLFLQIDNYKKDDTIDTSDYEHASISGGIYSQTY